MGTFGSRLSDPRYVSVVRFAALQLDLGAYPLGPSTGMHVLSQEGCHGSSARYQRAKPLARASLSDGVQVVVTQHCSFTSSDGTVTEVIGSGAGASFAAVSQGSSSIRALYNAREVASASLSVANASIATSRVSVSSSVGPTFYAVNGSTAPLNVELSLVCLLYTSPSPRDGLLSRMPSSA